MKCFHAMYFVVSLFVLTLPLVGQAGFSPFLINPTPGADVSTFKEIVKLQPGSPGCGGVLVGPRVILTAGHCVSNNQTMRFTVDGVEYKAKMTRSPKFTPDANNLAAGVVEKDVAGATPAFLGGKPVKGLAVTLFGYGCTEVNGGPTDGILRRGDNVIADILDTEIMTKKAGGAAICYGDSGTPLYSLENNKRIVMGINSRSADLKETNYHSRLDIKDATDFLTDWAIRNGNLKVCGLNSDCAGGSADPAPTCDLVADAASVKIGAALNLRLTPKGNFTSVTIDGVAVFAPAYTRSLITSQAGTFTSTGKITGPGGTTVCTAVYKVEEGGSQNPPSCTLTSSADQIKLGQPISLFLTSKGEVTSASIDGTTVTFPTGTKTITPAAAGNFTAVGIVSGPGGTASCVKTYTVDRSDGPVAPSCTLTADPNVIDLGQSLTLTLQTQGDVTATTLDGATATFPISKKVVTPSAKGTFTSVASVTGPGGTRTCSAAYSVQDPSDGTDAPNLTIVTAYCGDNTLEASESGVAKVCLAVLKKDALMRSMSVADVVVITNRDFSKEYLPIIHRKAKPSAPGDSRVIEDLTLYTNTVTKNGKNVILDSRKATLTRLAPASGGSVPYSIQGRSAKGQFFVIDKMTAESP